MKWRNFYIVMLYCAGFVLLAHTFVPHHHQKASGAIGQSMVKHEPSHHDDHHGHHHHKKAGEEKPASDNPISHPIHQESINKFVMKQTVVSVELLTVMYLLPGYFNTILPVPVKINTVHYKPDKDHLKPGGYRSCLALRGPPSRLLS